MVKKILFLCVGNSCRSQMAEGFARYLSSGNVEPISAGTRPAKKVAPKAIEVMRERGIDISGQTPKALTMEMMDKADVLVSMGCGVQESCPLPLRDDLINWGLEDPYGQSIEKYRNIRDEIERRVKVLIERMK